MAYIGNNDRELTTAQKVAVIMSRGGLTAIIPNVCILVGNDGTNYGALVGSYGTFSPEVIVDGTPFYQFTVNASGDIILKFGTTGDTQLEDTTEMLLQTKNHGDIILVWDETNSYYTINDQEFADAIIAADGEVVCGGLYALPDCFIEYTFNKFSTE